MIILFSTFTHWPSFRRLSAGTTRSASGEEARLAPTVQLPRHPDHHEHRDHHHDPQKDHDDQDEDCRPDELHKQATFAEIQLATDCTRVYYLPQRIYSTHIYSLMHHIPH